MAMLIQTKTDILEFYAAHSTWRRIRFDDAHRIHSVSLSAAVRARLRNQNAQTSKRHEGNRAGGSFDSERGSLHLLQDRITQRASRHHWPFPLLRTHDVQ